MPCERSFSVVCPLLIRRHQPFLAACASSYKACKELLGQPCVVFCAPPLLILLVLKDRLSYCRGSLGLCVNAHLRLKEFGAQLPLQKLFHLLTDPLAPRKHGDHYSKGLQIGG